MNKMYCLVCYHDTTRKAEILLLGDEYPKGWTSISQGAATVEELRQKVPLADEPCSVCGSPYSIGYTNAKNLIKYQMCFNCDFWREKIGSRTKDHVCVEGHFYRLGNANSSDSRMLGHGGRKFYVRRHGEKEVKVFNDVWHAGEIPPQFRDRLQDDADFLTEKDFIDADFWG